MHLSTSYHQSTLQAASLIVDCSQFNKNELRGVIAAKLDRERAVFLRNTGMKALREMSDWAAYLDIQQMVYEGGAGSRFDMGAGVLSVGTEPAHLNVGQHSEMAYWPHYPQHVMFGCESAPRTGGETVIASNERVTSAIEETSTGRKIFEVGIRYIRNYSDQNNPESIPSICSWQEAYHCTQWEEVEQQCAERGWRVKRRPDGSAKVAWLEQGFEFDEKTGRHLMFTSVARLGRSFDDWPPYSGLDDEQRPHHVTYADGSPFTAEEVSTLDHAFSRYTIPLRWLPGDIAVLENIAWTHSRPPYHLGPGEERKIGIVVSNHKPRLRQQA